MAEQQTFRAKPTNFRAKFSSVTEYGTLYVPSMKNAHFDCWVADDFNCMYIVLCMTDPDGITQEYFVCKFFDSDRKIREDCGNLDLDKNMVNDSDVLRSFINLSIDKSFNLTKSGVYVEPSSYVSLFMKTNMFRDYVFKMLERFLKLN
jgi:hypothetical protein